MKYLTQLHSVIQRLKIENASLRNAMKMEEKGESILHKNDLTGDSLLDPSTETLKQEEHKAEDTERDTKELPSSSANKSEVIPPFLDKYGRLIHSRTGERIYIGSSSMTLFGLEINRLVADSGVDSTCSSPVNPAAETVLEREGNAYRIMLGKTHTRPGIDVNFTLPSYSYALLLVDSFISYNDGCFYFFNEGLIKEGLRRVYDEEPGKPFKPDYGSDSSGVSGSSAEGGSTLETIWFCKVLLIFAIGEMYLGTANNLNGYKLSEKPRRKRQKSSNATSATTKLPGSGFFNQASKLFTGLFASGAIDNCARDGGIEVLLLYAFYLQVADCTVASYFYFGLALRASLILGLHVDIGRDSLNRYELEHRRRLWWTVYMYERMLASKAGLPLSLTDDDISTALPDDFDMSNPPKGCENYVFPEAEFIRNCVKITQINTRILRKLYTRHPSSNILPVVHELVVSLLRWKKELPDYINCDYSAPELHISRLVVNLMTEYFQGVNLAVRPLLFHFVMLNLKSQRGEFVDLSRYSPVILTLLNASFQASIHTIRSLWALLPDNMIAMFGYMDREYLFTSTVTLILFNSTFGVHAATLQHVDHALTIFTKMRNLGNHPATLRREQILRLLTILDFHGAMRGLIQKHSDHTDLSASTVTVNSQNDDSSGFKFRQAQPKGQQEVQKQQQQRHQTYSEPTLSAVLPTPQASTEAPGQRIPGTLPSPYASSQFVKQMLGSPSGISPQFGASTTPSPYWPNSVTSFPTGDAQNPIFSPHLLSSLGEIENVPGLESMTNSNAEDAELWKDITSQAVWLANDVGEEFNQLANRNG
ncbi:DEKNAAC100208 [Brettanomyces naardenensis]|uniref:DEKNAAC100208 n=1 Tax=Brettanomyces naardenensis TaxID=13370 RepID=A0A448YEW1_BRENA|nr:DEKNAAC100208 [Brettanomyces naardenensis]